MDGKSFALVLIIFIIGVERVSKFIYNYHCLEDEVIDLRRRLGR